MNEQTQNAEINSITAHEATVNDFKHAVLAVSVLINLAIFVSWILEHAANGTI